MQAMVAIQMRIGMARPLLMPLVPLGYSALTTDVIVEMNRAILQRLGRTPYLFYETHT
jgi:hypothetical protein